MSDCIRDDEMELLKYFILDLLITELNIIKKNIDCSDFDALISISEIDKQLQLFKDLQDKTFENIIFVDKYVKMIELLTNHFTLIKHDILGECFTLYDSKEKKENYDFKDLGEMIDFLTNKDKKRVSRKNLFKIIK